MPGWNVNALGNRVCVCICILALCMELQKEKKKPDLEKGTGECEICHYTVDCAWIFNIIVKNWLVFMKRHFPWFLGGDSMMIGWFGVYSL